MHNSLVVIQRQTPDWGGMSEAEFLQQSQDFCRLWGKPQHYLETLYRLWNDTFTISYCEVRQFLKVLSEANIRSARDVRFIAFEDYKNIPVISDTYYLFIDDDDWIDPSISDHLGVIDQQAFPVILWRSANIGSPNQSHPVFIWGLNGRCMTNNYAVSSHWLMLNNKLASVIQHKDAASVFNAFTQPVPHLDLAVTVSNKSPVSSVSLDRGLDGDFSSEKLCSLIASYVIKMKKTNAEDFVRIPWAQTLLAETVVFFERVLQSCR